MFPVTMSQLISFVRLSVCPLKPAAWDRRTAWRLARQSVSFRIPNHVEDRPDTGSSIHRLKSVPHHCHFAGLWVLRRVV